MSKETARSKLWARRIGKEELPNEPKERIKLVRLYLEAGEPIPVELHDTVSDACNAWIGARPSNLYKDDDVYQLVYHIKLWGSEFKSEDVRNFHERALGRAEVIFDNKRAEDIYKASSKHYRKRKHIVDEAKRDAEWIYANQNWGLD